VITDKTKRINLIVIISSIAFLILAYFSCSNEKTEKEKYAELKLKIENYYTIECGSIDDLILADSMITGECISYIKENPKSKHLKEIKSYIGKKLDYKVGDCFKENIKKYLYEHRFDYLNQSVTLVYNDTSIVAEIDSILTQKTKLKRYYDEKAFDILDLEKQLNYKKSNCLFPFSWNNSKRLLYEKFNSNALEIAYNSLGTLEKTKNEIDKLEYIIYTEDSTVKDIYSPSQERVVQYNIIYAIKLKTLPSTNNESSEPGFFEKIRRFISDGSSLLTGNFPTTIKMVKVSGYIIGKVNYDDAVIDIKQNVLYDSCKIIK
jgi:hypothetical protein